MGIDREIYFKLIKQNKMKTYRIFDANASIMSDYPIINGKTATEAVKKYLSSIGQQQLKIKVSGSNYVRFSAEPVVIENGKTYRLSGKRTIWYEVIHESIN